MTVLAIVPARGGSKRILRKNVFMLAGRPLVEHTVVHARQAASVDEVVVSTDDAEIAAIAGRAGVQVVERPHELGSDEATSESALMHVLDERCARGLDDPELVVFLQCTSPIRAAGDIDDAVATLRREEADSLFSAVADRGLLWSLEAAGPRPLNYDPLQRLREQNMPEQMRENGSIYVFRPALLRETGSRLGGKIAIHEMDFWSSFQIDTPEDLELASWILARRGPAVQWPERLELLVFDFDGVMTDNRVFVDQDGRESVAAHRGDGWGLARLRDAGVPMLVLSTEANPVVAARCAKLGLPHLQGVDDKAAALAAELGRRGIDPAHVAFVGNDVNDLACLRLVGLPIVVGDAHPDVLDAAVVVLSRAGGQGAVRELCDLVLAR